MLLYQLALISQTKKIKFSELALVASALQKQVSRDFAPLWNVNATIDVFADLKDMPLGYWPIIIMDDIAIDGAAGIHLDTNNQPYSLVQYSNSWSLTASHEAIEMLADPFGNRLVTADSILQGQGRVQYLVEVCDPCESEDFAYTVNGVLVSDFYTPHFFDPIANVGIQYSFTGALKKPLEILPGGYLSWIDPTTNEWYQGTYFGQQLTIQPITGMKALTSGSLRSRIDSLTKVSLLTNGISNKKLLSFVKSKRASVLLASASKAQDLQSQF